MKVTIDIDESHNDMLTFTAIGGCGTKTVNTFIHVISVKDVAEVRIEKTGNGTEVRAINIKRCDEVE